MAIIISTLRAMEGEPLLIVSYPTGVIYEAQCGGMSCDQKRCEGFILKLYNLSLYLNLPEDCPDLCWGADKEENKIVFANKLQTAFNDPNYDGYIGILPVKLNVDFNRVSEFSEAWWPVKMKFGYDENDGDDIHGEFSGYLHHGNNCD